MQLETHTGTPHLDYAAASGVWAQGGGNSPAPPAGPSGPQRSEYSLAGNDRSGAQVHVTIPYEERLIIVAQGKQFTNAQIPEGWGIPAFLQANIKNFQSTDDSNMSYSSDAQHVNFTIQRVQTKSGFMQALQTEGAMVVYGGHARYGQGPCFGDTDAPGEEWGSKSADPTATGVFRAGFPYIGLPIDEICDEHQYTADPVDGGSPKPDSSDIHPHARQMYGQMKQFSISDLASKCKASQAQVQAFLGNADAGDTFWGYDGIGESGKYERHVLLKCGWDNTDISPNDVGGVDMNCKAFIFIGCSTFIHNYPIIRKIKGWTKDGDNRLAYWTTRATSGIPMTAYWMYYLLSYSKRNDNQPWEPSLEWTKNMTNRQYASMPGVGPSSLI